MAKKRAPMKRKSYLHWRNATDEDILYVLKADRRELAADLSRETGISVSSIYQIRDGLIYKDVYKGVPRERLYSRERGCVSCRWYVFRGQDNGRPEGSNAASPPRCRLQIKEFEEMGYQICGAQCLWFNPPGA